MKLNINNAGLQAEKLAETYLLSQGLKLIVQNYHCRFGEIDLVMLDEKTLVFVEVKLRSNSQFGGAAASITPQKQQKMILTAQHYLQQALINNQFSHLFKTEPACRFDAILMPKADLKQIEWIRNAFET